MVERRFYELANEDLLCERADAISPSLQLEHSDGRARVPFSDGTWVDPRTFELLINGVIMPVETFRHGVRKVFYGHPSESVLDGGVSIRDVHYVRDGMLYSAQIEITGPAVHSTLCLTNSRVLLKGLVYHGGDDDEFF